MRRQCSDTKSKLKAVGVLPIYSQILKSCFSDDGLMLETFTIYITTTPTPFNLLFYIITVSVFKNLGS